MIKGQIHKEDIIIVNIYAPNVEVSKCILANINRSKGRNKQQNKNNSIPQFQHQINHSGRNSVRKFGFKWYVRPDTLCIYNSNRKPGEAGYSLFQNSELPST